MDPAGSDRYLEEIRSYLAGDLRVAPQSLADDEPLLGALLDSIALLTLATHLEERYGIAIGAGEVDPDNFGTLGALARFVARKSGEV